MGQISQLFLCYRFYEGIAPETDQVLNIIREQKRLSYEYDSGKFRAYWKKSLHIHQYFVWKLQIKISINIILLI